MNEQFKSLNINSGAKKKLSLIAMILALAEFILAFLPLYFSMHYWTSDRSRGYSPNIRLNIFADQSFTTICFALLYLSLLLLSVVVLLLLFLNIKNQFTKICSFAPIASILFLIVTVVYVDSLSVSTLNYNNYVMYRILKYETEPIIWLLFLIHIVVNLLTLIVAIDLKSKAATDVSSSNTNPEKAEELDTDEPQIPQAQEEDQIKARKENKMNLDDLVKLKELLDKGIITQEEFDAKKKQILGL